MTTCSRAQSATPSPVDGSSRKALSALTHAAIVSSSETGAKAARLAGRCPRDLLMRSRNVSSRSAQIKPSRWLQKLSSSRTTTSSLRSKPVTGSSMKGRSNSSSGGCATTEPARAPTASRETTAAIARPPTARMTFLLLSDGLLAGKRGHGTDAPGRARRRRGPGHRVCARVVPVPIGPMVPITPDHTGPPTIGRLAARARLAVAWTGRW